MGVQSLCENEIDERYFVEIFVCDPFKVGNHTIVLRKRKMTGVQPLIVNI